uniref:Uncharacterized protein n=1 Tax=Solanum lycopersicum TaxID=4081 RepID=A0A3Q7I654_SOLLC
MIFFKKIVGVFEIIFVKVKQSLRPKLGDSPLTGISNLYCNVPNLDEVCYRGVRKTSWEKWTTEITYLIRGSSVNNNEVVSKIEGINNFLEDNPPKYQRLSYLGG